MVKIKRLQNKNTIKKLLSIGNVYKTKKYKFYYFVGKEEFSYAISVSKKLGIATLRNKEKRWLRSIIYQNRFLFKKGGYAFIVIKENGGLFSDASNEVISFICQNFK
ncbi:MAG: ribonuclease P protein component [Spirochaetota bacterium]